MKWITARRRHPLAGYVVVLLALAVFGVGYAALAPNAERAEAQVLAAQSSGPEEGAVDIAEGRDIWNRSCASCHGETGGGSGNAPDITTAGGASIDFQVSTGRMPSSNPDAQMPRKDPAFSRSEIDNLIAFYEQEIGKGPAVPVDVPGDAPVREDFDSEEAYEKATEEYQAEYDAYIAGADDVEAGMKLYLANCAHCHSWSGAGGGLTDGHWAPELTDATPRQIYEAMSTGPGQMPVFNDLAINPDDKQELIAYVKNLQAEPDAGGIFALNRVGQVAEGLIGWTVGLTLIIACAIWITAKQRAHD
ncbi:c-type cytochrome [Nocardiopsis composta]|uniref:Ubiquinol-cytochrome c reductase cytochrome c subunit n=1 Tax=Nocardiopsis composta TaxID=157465 RepID=A0A7W8QT39_9ACTN|nr:c-type cytochrome [Nocardiopsis composta]MBB5435674.1 ubiquinol-cytochrome c reductase cytochrome c subunit [Nocardiopsis composta]